MRRVGAAFIALCMVIIAGAIAAALYLALGLGAMESALVGLTILTSLAVYNSASGRTRDRDDVGTQIGDLSRGTADLARQVGELGRRVVVVESTSTAAGDRAVGAAAPVAAELAELGSLIRQLAETVSNHEARLAALAAQRAPLQAASPAAAAPQRAAAPAPVASPAPRPAAPVADNIAVELGEPVPDHALSGHLKGIDHGEILRLIRDAIDANRIDLYLQPIVSLPQRKVRYYEAEARLRTEDGVVLAPDEFMSFAESGGLMPRIDNLMLFRCVQVVRRLTTRNREIGLFCNISGATLADSEFFPQLADFMQANRALAPSLVLEFSQSAMRAMGPIENESLGQLTDLGFRFSLDNVADLRLEPRDLAERGFRFVKLPGSLLLNRVGAGTDIHPADFSDLLGRSGIDLIAEKIESEGMVIDLLDYDVRFGQGSLFSPPRPVRAEALQGLADTARRDQPAAEAKRPQAPGSPPAQATPAPPPPGAVPAPASETKTAGDARISVLSQIARGIARRA